MLRLSVCFVVADGAFSPGPGPNGLARTPPMGWMSWQVFRCQTDCLAHPDGCIDHNLFEQMADHLVSEGYLDIGYDTISVDDCWGNAYRDADKHLYPNADRFPAGMKALGEYIHSKGAKFGHYADEGSLTCMGYAGSVNSEAVDTQTFSGWGVDYLKLDGCYNDAKGFASGYPAFGNALQASGRNITYSCSWPAYIGSNESSKPFDAMIDAGCNLWRNWADIDCNWNSLSSIIDHWGDYGPALQPYAGPGHWHDMDNLLVGAGCLTVEEEKTQMAIWAISASPLFMGNDLRNVPAASKSILLNRDAIAVSQDGLGKMGIRLGENLPTQIWFRELQNGDVAVALYNKASNSSCDITVAFSDVGLSGEVKAYDIWTQQEVGVQNNSFTAKMVPVHGTAFVRLSMKTFVVI